MRGARPLTAVAGCRQRFALCAPNLCLTVHAVLERVCRLTSDQEQYNEHILLVVLFEVRERGVDGRGRAMYRNTRLGKNVRNSQILTTYAWTPSRVVCVGEGRDAWDR